MSTGSVDTLKRFRSNPFWILGATPRDDRKTIIGLAQSRMLETDAEQVRKARSTLTNPRSRLTAELSWLPGLSPGRAAGLLDLLEEDPAALRTMTGVPPLAECNLLAAALPTLLSSTRDMTEGATSILSLARTMEAISRDSLLRDINGDRKVADFPPVPSEEHLEKGLSTWKRSVRDAVRDALDRLPSETLVDAMVHLLEESTAGGRQHPPKLVEGVVDQYDLAARAFLEAEADNLRHVMTKMRTIAVEEPDRLPDILTALESVARNWDRVAQPVQLSFQALGRDHLPSVTLANEIRALAVELVNDHGHLEESRRLIQLVEEVFAELPDVVEQSTEDHEALDELFKGRRKLQAEVEEWAQGLTYEANLGSVFKKILSISPDGVAWKGRSYPLDAVTRVRWGATRHSVNGVPTGTSYTIAFGDDRSEAAAEFRDSEVFSEFVDRLYRGVGVRILTDWLERLRDGESVAFGPLTVWDPGVVLPKRGLFSSGDVTCNWGEVKVWSARGYFHIQAKADEKAHVARSYVNDVNTHLLEQAIRMAFERGSSRLSDLLG